jgi:hypothetical protein
LSLEAADRDFNQKLLRKLMIVGHRLRTNLSVVSCHFFNDAIITPEQPADSEHRFILRSPIAPGGQSRISLLKECDALTKNFTSSK